MAPLKKTIRIALFRHSYAGFTLIELLVVVLIIGILASIAAPQYQKAVEKSRATHALTLLKSLGQAQEAYYMTNGTYATSFDVLDVNFPPGWTGTSERSGSTDPHTNQQWNLYIQTNPDLEGTLLMFRATGPYAWAGFVYRPDHILSEIDRGKGITCIESVASFQKNPNDYCVKLFRGTLYKTNSARHYTLP